MATALAHSSSEYQINICACDSYDFSSSTFLLVEATLFAIYNRSHAEVVWTKKPLYKTPTLV